MKPRQHLEHWDNHYFSTYLFYAYGVMADTIVDVGVYDYSFVERYKDQCNRVVGFEPSKNQFNNIEETAKRTGSYIEKGVYKNQIQVNNIAVSNEKCHKTFYQNLNNDGCSSLIRDMLPPQHQYEEYEVDCDTLDNVFLDYEHKIDYIKIDTEWNDINVLYGAKEIIKKHRPIIQVHHYVPEMDDFFIEQKYKRITPPSYVYKFYWVPEELKKWDGDNE